MSPKARTEIEAKVLAAAGIAPPAPVASEQSVLVLNAPRGLYRCAIVELALDGSAWRIVRERPATTRAVAQAQAMDEMVSLYARRNLPQPAAVA